MNIKRASFFAFGLFFLFLLSFNVVYSACATHPDEIVVYSGQTNLGSFSPGDSIYVKNNFAVNPLKFEFYFTNNEQNCYVADNLKFRLIPSGAYTSFDSVTESALGEGLFTAKAVKVINSDYDFTGTLVSAYQFSNKNGDLPGANTLNLVVDNTAPSVDVSFGPVKTIYDKDDSVSFTVGVSDSGAGLLRLAVGGIGTSKIVIYEGNSSSQLTFSDVISQSGNYTVTAVDMLGNSFTKEIRFNVDTSAPVLSNLNMRSVYRDSKDYITYSVDVSDDSFGFGTDVIVTGDFSQINPSFSSVSSTCSFVENSVSVKRCVFSEVPSTLTATNDVKVKIKGVDFLGKETITEFDSRITIDTTAPEILRFEVVNGLGVSNVVSASGRNVSVFLEVKDESITDVNFRRVGDFGLIAFEPPNPVCANDYDITKCRYDISDEIAAYSGYENYVDNFSITVFDSRGNSKTERFSLLVDNGVPEVDEVELSEASCSGRICDGVVSSNEEIDFKVYINDKNVIYSGEHFISADFSNIDFGTGKDYVLGNCRDYDPDTVECTFSGIKVGNGYFNRTVSFRIMDVSGNGFYYEYPVEVLAIGDEVPSSFSIPDIVILNPLNRNLMKNAGGKAWFSGEIKSHDENMRIINYQLVGCNVSELNPFLVINSDTGLFPNSIVINSGQDDVNEFTMSVGLRLHPNGVDMNKKQMSCTMSILKRDDTKIYEPERVDFDLVFEFYGDITGDILRAHAEDLMRDIEDAEMLGDWFDTTFEIYNVLSTACSAVSTADSILSGVSSVAYGTQWVLASFNIIDGGVTSNAIGTAAYNPKAFLGETVNGVLSPVKRMCDYVTCRNGGILTNAIMGTNLGEGAQELYEAMNQPISALCMVGEVIDSVTIEEED